LSRIVLVHGKEKKRRKKRKRRERKEEKKSGNLPTLLEQEN
jgi:hypothetical protein